MARTNCVSLTLALLTLWVAFVNSQDSENGTKSSIDAEWESFINNKLKTFDQDLHQATQKVVRLETTELSPDFYHSFLPGTGHLNREELEIDGISSIGEIVLLGDDPAEDWDVIEYRGIEYMVGANEHGLTFVWRNADGFIYSHAAVGKVVSVLHVILPNSDGSIQLYLAALREDSTGRHLTFYVLEGNELSLTEVGDHPMADDVHELRSMFVPYRNYNFIIAVRDGQENTQVYSKVYQVFERDGLVQLREFTDIACSGRCTVRPFLVQGEALIAVANTGMASQLLRFDHKLLDFSLVQKFVPAVDVETFRIGLHYFLAWLTRDTLAIYTYNGADFSVWQTERGQGFASVEMLHVPTCRDEVLIVVTSVNNRRTTVDLLKYYGEGNNFTLVEGKVCATWKKHPNSNVHSPLAAPSRFNTLMEAEAGCLKAGELCRGIQHHQGPKGHYELQSRGKKKATGAQGQHFYEKHLSERMECVDRLGIEWRSIQALGLVNTSVLMAYSTVTKTTHIIAVASHLRSQDNPIWQENAFLMSRVKTLEKELVNQEIQIADIESTLSRAVRPYGDQTLKGRYTFTGDVTATDGATASILEVLGDLEFERSNLRMEDFTFPLEVIENKIAAIEDAVTRLGLLLDDIVYVDENALITGFKEFLGPLTMADVLSAAELNIGTILGADVTAVLRDIVRLTGLAVTVAGTKTLPAAHVLADLGVDTTVNGIDLSEEVVNTYSDQVIEGSVTYLEELAVFGDVEVSGRVGHLDLSEDALTLDASGPISGNKHFKTKVSVRGDARAYTVDSVDVGALAQIVVTLSKDQIIDGGKTMGDVIGAAGVHIHGLVNDVDMTYVDSVAVRLDGDDVILAEKLFVKDVFVSGDLWVIDTINGVKIPEDLFSTDTSQIVTGLKVFTGPRVVVGDLMVEGLVDGLVLPSDVVPLSTDQIIDGNYMFINGIKVSQDLEVDGLVDGVDVSELYLGALRIDSDVTATLDMLLAGGATIDGDLNVDTEVNGIDLSDLLDDFIFSDGGDYVITGTKTGIGRVTVPDLQLDGEINGFTMADFVDLTSDSSIQGTKTFAEPITVGHDVFVTGLVDQVDLDKLKEERVTLSGDQDVDGHLVFIDEVVVEGNVYPAGEFGGLDVNEDLVLADRDQEITGKKVFDSVHTDNIIVGGNLEVTGLVDGVDMAALNEQRVPLEEGKGRSVQPIEERLFLDKVDVEGPMTADLINGQDFWEFLRNIVTTNTEQEIIGAKAVRALSVPSAVTSKGISGVYLRDVRDWAIPVNGAEATMEGILSFSHLTLGDVSLGGKLGGVDLGWLLGELVTRTGPYRIAGSKTFADGFTVLGNLNTGTVNGIQIEDLLTIFTEQVITGTYIFPSVRVTGSLQVGSVNGVDLSEFAAMVMRTDRENTLDGSLVVQNTLTVDGDVIVGGFVNGVDLEDLKSRVVLLDGDQVVTGRKGFMASAVVGDVEAETVNGLDLGDWAGDVVYIDVDQIVIGEKSFPTSSAVDITSSCDVAVGGLVGGQNLEELTGSAIYTSGRGEAGGALQFRKSVTVRGDVDAEPGITINGVDISEVLTLSGDQVVTGRLTLALAASGGDLVVNTVNGFPVDQLPSDTLVTSGGDVTGRKSVIGGAVYTDDVIVDGLTAGLDLSEDVVPLRTAQIVASKHFTSPVAVDGNLEVTGYINGVDLSDLARRALYQDLDGQEVTSEYQLVGDVTFVQDVITDGLVDGVDLSELQRRPNWGPIIKYLTNFQDVSKSYCDQMNQLMTHLGGGFKQLHSWDWWLDYNVIATSLSSLDTVGRLHVALSVTEEGQECRRTAVYDCTRNTPQLMEYLESGDSHDVELFESEGEEYLAVAALSCGGVGGSSVWKFDPSTHSMVLYVPLNLPAIKVKSLVFRGDVFVILVGGRDFPLVVVKEQPGLGYQTIAELPPGVIDAAITVHNEVIYVATCDSFNGQIFTLDGAGLTHVQNLYKLPSPCHSVTFFTARNRTFLALARDMAKAVWSGSPAHVRLWVFWWTPAPTPWSLFLHERLVQGLVPVSLGAFQAGPDQYLLAAVSGTGSMIYRYEGASAIVKVMTVIDWKVVSGQVVKHGDKYSLLTVRREAPARVYLGYMHDSSLERPDQDCCELDLALDQLTGFTSEFDERIIPPSVPETIRPYVPDRRPPYIPHVPPTAAPITRPPYIPPTAAPIIRPPYIPEVRRPYVPANRTSAPVIIQTRSTRPPRVPRLPLTPRTRAPYVPRTPRPPLIATPLRTRYTVDKTHQVITRTQHREYVESNPDELDILVDNQPIETLQEFDVTQSFNKIQRPDVDQGLDVAPVPGRRRTSDLSRGRATVVEYDNEETPGTDFQLSISNNGNDESSLPNVGAKNSVEKKSVNVDVRVNRIPNAAGSSPMDYSFNGASSSGMVYGVNEISDGIDKAVKLVGPQRTVPIIVETSRPGRRPIVNKKPDVPKRAEVPRRPDVPRKLDLPGRLERVTGREAPVRVPLPLTHIEDDQSDTETSGLNLEANIVVQPVNIPRRGSRVRVDLDSVQRPPRSSSTNWNLRRPPYMRGSYNAMLGAPRYYQQA